MFYQSQMLISYLQVKCTQRICPMQVLDQLHVMMDMMFSYLQVQSPKHMTYQSQVLHHIPLISEMMIYYRQVHCMRGMICQLQVINQLHVLRAMQNPPPPDYQPVRFLSDPSSDSQPAQPFEFGTPAQAG